MRYPFVLCEGIAPDDASVVREAQVRYVGVFKLIVIRPWGVELAGRFSTAAVSPSIFSTAVPLASPTLLLRWTSTTLVMASEGSAPRTQVPILSAVQAHQGKLVDREEFFVSPAQRRTRARDRLQESFARIPTLGAIP